MKEDKEHPQTDQPSQQPTCEDKGAYCIGKYGEACKVCLKEPSQQEGKERVEQTEQRSIEYNFVYDEKVGLDLQKSLRDKIFIRPYNIHEIESAALKLCDYIIDLPPCSHPKAIKESLQGEKDIWLTANLTETLWHPAQQRDYELYSNYNEFAQRHLEIGLKTALINSGQSQHTATALGELYVIIGIDAEPIGNKVYTNKADADAVCKKNWLGTYSTVSLSEHIESLLTWYKPGEQEVKDEMTATALAEKDREIERLNKLLDHAEIEIKSANEYSARLLNQLNK